MADLEVTAGNEVVFTVTGKLNDGSVFKGSCEVKITD